jgi:hypothetical protein
MPGGRPRNLRPGDRSELLVELLLTGLAFTARVPRQEDHGVDFFCNLTSEEGNLVKAGPFFSVQAKSSTEPIVYEKPHELEWILNQEQPLLLCVADREAVAVDFYSTWNLLCAVLYGWHGKSRAIRISLLPGAEQLQWPGVDNLDDGSQVIRLGRPIARFSDKDAFDDTKRRHFASLIRDWVTLDRMNIVNRWAGLYWVLGPTLDYQTNQPLRANYRVAFYHNPENLNSCTTNLGRLTTALIEILPTLGIDLEASPWSFRYSVLKDVVKSYWELFDPSVREILLAQGMGR